MKKRKTNTKAIVIISITIALIILLQLFAALLQKIGMPMSLALGLIPVFVIAETHGIKYGAICGGFFGLITLLFSVIYMAGVPIYRVSANPLVSVFPRIMAGVVCALAYGGFTRLILKRHAEMSVKKRRVTLLGISMASTILGVITNTALYLGMFFAFANGRTFDDLVIDLKWIISSVVALNTVIELVLFALVVPSIVYAMTRSKLSEKLSVANNILSIEKAEADIPAGEADASTIEADEDISDIENDAHNDVDSDEINN